MHGVELDLDLRVCRIGLVEKEKMYLWRVLTVNYGVA